MNLSLIRSMTRSAVFELENGLCFRPAHPFVVTLNGKTVYEACNTNVFSLFSLLPGTEYTVGVQAEGETLSLTFVTEAESFFVDASRYGLVADGETDNTGKLQAALSTCPKGGTVYVPAGRYRTASLFLKSNTTLYLEKGAVLLGDNDRTHYPILPGVLPSENEVDEYYLFHAPSEDQHADDDEDDVDFALVGDDHTVDLGEAIRDTLVMETPFVVLCQPDCKGLCPVCGANLNKEDCGHAAQIEAQREKERLDASPFAALRDLDLGDGEGRPVEE